MKIDWQRGVDEIDAVFFPNEGWDFEITQLGAGLLGYRACTIELPGLMIRLETLDQPIRNMQIMRQNVFYAAFAISAPRPVLWKGLEVLPDNALIFGHIEHDVVVPEDSLLLNIEVEAEMAAQMGLLDLEPGLWSCDPAAQQRFYDLCRRLAQHPSQGHGCADDTTALRNLLLSQFLAVLGTPRQALATRQYDITYKAERLILQQGWSENMGVDTLADAIGVSRRTMHRSFKDLYGLGPQGYLRLVRLHHFRHMLLQGKSAGVTDAALGAGFEHFGRAARYYRQHFGELPKQTLLRAS